MISTPASWKTIPLCPTPFSDQIKTHMNSTTRGALTEITGPHFTNAADYDVVSQMMFPNVECFTSMLADPFYKENVMPDDANFADMSRTKYGPLHISTPGFLC